MSVIKDIALGEPLVDVVDSKAVISNSKPILAIDISTCTTDDLSFTSEFSLQFTRNDFCHAFVAYFECAFTKIHKPIIFSTSPHAPYTHWKQTVFYLSEALTVCKDETVTGKLICKPNEKNNRDLDITVQWNMSGKFTETSKEQFYRLR